MNTIFARTLAALALSVSLAACANTPEAPEALDAEVQTDVQRVLFATPDGQNLELITRDGWETAELKGAQNRNLHVEPSANGIYLVAEDGLSVHFKDDVGFLDVPGEETVDLKVIEHRDLQE